MVKIILVESPATSYALIGNGGGAFGPGISSRSRSWSFYNLGSATMVDSSHIPLMPDAAAFLS